MENGPLRAPTLTLEFTPFDPSETPAFTLGLLGSPSAPQAANAVSIPNAMARIILKYPSSVAPEYALAQVLFHHKIYAIQQNFAHPARRTLRR